MNGICEQRVPRHAKSATIRGVSVFVRRLHSPPPPLYHRHQFTTIASGPLPLLSPSSSLLFSFSLSLVRWLSHWGDKMERGRLGLPVLARIPKMFIHGGLLDGPSGKASGSGFLEHDSSGCAYEPP
nr:unnamed protein product [Digitaria exilis]